MSPRAQEALSSSCPLWQIPFRGVAVTVTNYPDAETPRRHFWLLSFSVSLWLCGSILSLSRADALAKLKPDKLQAVHQAIQELRVEWKPIPRQGLYREYRANLHVHSSLSHDSRG